jgi:alginate O-acetyltransferase complex protein AlgI
MHTMTTLAFLYVILPLAMAVFLLCPPVWRRGALLAVSLCFFLLVQPSTFPLLLLCLATDWLILAFLHRYHHSQRFRRGCVALSVVKNLLVILVLETLLQMNRLVEAPWGLRVYTLSSLSCVLEAYQGEVPREYNPISYLLYCCFFPRLEAGPLLPYRDFAPQLESLNPTLTGIGSGFGLFLQGAVKTGVLGQALQVTYEALRAFPAEDMTVAGTWCTVLILGLSVYYRLSGLGDMARGLGQMMGISLPKNFYYPYQSQGVTDFFQRFNITISGFIRRNVYQPLQGESSNVLADCLNLILWGVLMGLWFGLQVNYLLWGAFLSLFLILEKHVFPDMMKKIPPLFLRLYTLCVVLSSFAIFGGASPGASAATIHNMFRFQELNLYNDRLVYLLTSNWLLLAVSLLFATSAVSLLLSFLRKALPRFTALLTAAANAVLLVVFTVFTIRVG